MAVYKTMLPSIECRCQQFLPCNAMYA